MESEFSVASQAPEALGRSNAQLNRLLSREQPLKVHPTERKLPVESGDAAPSKRSATAPITGQKSYEQTQVRLMPDTQKARGPRLGVGERQGPC